MNQDDINYAVISNAINTISLVCAGDRDKIIDLLSDYLFSPSETDSIRNSSGDWDAGRDAEEAYNALKEQDN